jgi:hypothetical protein
MKRIICLLSVSILLTAYSNNAFSQYYFYNDDYYDNPILFEAGFSIGAMNSLTDIGGNKGIGKRFVKDLNMGKTSFCGGLFLTATYKNAVALRLEGTYGKVSANDNVLAGVNPTDIAKMRYNRNCNFRSNIAEASLIVELHPLFMFVNYEDRESDPPRLSPYLLGGVGYYSFKPQAELNGKWIDLQPLGTEGQGNTRYPDKQPYKLQQMNFPVGLGLKYELSPLMNLRGEYVYRVLQTDYLDDVSTVYMDVNDIQYRFPVGSTNYKNAYALSDRQIYKATGVGGKRGSPKQKDAYFSLNIKLSITLGREKIR